MLYTSNQWQTYGLDTMILDLNGTLQVWWVVSTETIDLLWELISSWWKIYLLTWNQRNNAHEYEAYWLEVVIAKNGKEKEEFTLTQNLSSCVSIWNARIDIGMCKHSEISIATVQWEWVHVWLLSHVDILIPRIEDALRMFVDTDRFSATMKM